SLQGTYQERGMKGRQGDKETRRPENRLFSLSPGLLVSLSRFFHVSMNRRMLEAILEQALQILTHGRGVAAAEAEAVALHSRDVGIHRPELRRRRGRTDLAEFGPAVDQHIATGALDDDGETLLPVGRDRGGPGF